MLPFIATAMTISDIAAASPSGTPVSFNGLFSTSANNSVVESPVLTADVPGGSSGSITFQGFVMTGIVKLYSDVNGAGFTEQGEDTEAVLTDGQTLQLRLTGVSSGEALEFDLIDTDTGLTIENVIMNRP